MGWKKPYIEITKDEYYRAINAINDDYVMVTDNEQKNPNMELYCDG